ncbi:MAG: mechanosensitive ion channel [Candidatus Bathyarchaeota archaeon]|nr:mechanosensitive ion channel [Candidatus Bathyarchaeota archaeon]
MQIAGIEIIQAIEVIIALTATYIIAKIVSRALMKVFEKTPFPESVENGIIKASKYVVYIVGIFVIVSLLGVDLTSLIVGLGAFSIAISFAMSNIIQNFVSGLLVQADRVFKVGDEIRVQTFEGRVVKISIRTTLIETKEGDIVSIPNSIFATNAVIRKKSNRN